MARIYTHKYIRQTHLDALPFPEGDGPVVGQVDAVHRHEHVPAAQVVVSGRQRVHLGHEDAAAAVGELLVAAEGGGLHGLELDAEGAEAGVAPVALDVLQKVPEDVHGDDVAWMHACMQGWMGGWMGD